MAEIRLDLQDAAESAAGGILQQGSERRLEAALMTHAEDEPGLAAERDGALRADAGHGERLFAEDMLAGRDRRLDLRAVELVRRREDHRLDIAAGECGVIVGQEIQPVFGRERGAVRIRLDSADDVQVRVRAP